MLKFFSFGKINAGVLVTLLVLIALGSSYFFIYVPGNEKVVQERRFRCLRKIDLSIRTKIKTSKVQIKTIINDYYRYSYGKTRDPKKLDTLRRYIIQSSKKNYTILLPELANTYFDNKENDNLENQPAYIGDDPSGNSFYIAIRSNITILVTRSIDNANPITSAKGKKTNRLTIGLQFESDQFIKPLLLTDVFDYFVVFVNKDKIYEDFPTGLNYQIPDSLLTVRNKVTSPGIRSFQIGETDFKVFSHPAFTYTDNKWIITGLLKNSNYQKEKNQLPLWVLLLLTTTAIVIFISLPWIKLYHMGSKDRLTINDGIASLLVSIILMSFLFFVFFKYRIDIQSDRLSYKSKTNILRYNREEYSRELLASKITDAFRGEINQVCNALDAFNNYYKTHKPKTNISLLGTGPTVFDSLYKKYKDNLGIREVYWLNDSGTEITNMTTDSNNSPKANYKTRPYFIKAGSYKMGNHKFYLDQIFSYTKGDFKSVISEKTSEQPDSKEIAAVSFKLKSLDSAAVMPDGYQFAIINDTGRVLYHKKANRNLVEQLQNEFVNRKDLVSALAARSDTSFKTEYYGRLYNVKIKPIPELPYYTVIFEDIEYNDARDTEAYTFTLSMLFGMLIFLCVKFCIIFFVSARRSFFKKQHFDTSWIAPRRTCHHYYNISIIVNLFIISLLVVFFDKCSFLTYLYILLVSVVFTSIFLNGILAVKYKQTDYYKYRFKVKTIIALSIFVIVIDIPAFYNLDPGCIGTLLLYELILVVICPFICLLSSKLLIKLRQIKMHRALTWTFTNSYALMVTTRLIISSGIPVAFFFIYSFNYEQNLNTRYRQLNFAKALLKIDPKLDTSKNIPALNSKLDSIKKNLVYTSGIYFDGIVIDRISVNKSKRILDSLKKDSLYTAEDALTATVLNSVRLVANNLEQHNNFMNLSFTGDTAFFSKLNRKSNDTSSVETYYKLDTSKYIRVSSKQKMNYRTPHSRFWILFLLSLVVFYRTIHLIIKKLFAINLPSTRGWAQIDKDVLLNNQLNQMLLIVGSPGSNTLQKLIVHIHQRNLKAKGGKPLVIDSKDPVKNNVFIADMMRISGENGDTDPDWVRHKKEALEGHGLVIINHFEYNIKDAGVNKIKLNLIEELIEQNISKVIIISTMHPLIFLDSFSEYRDDDISESERGRWHSLLGHFRVLIDNFVGSEVFPDAQMPKKAIIDETQYSRFLHRMQTASLKFQDRQILAIASSNKDEEEITDSLIFKIQLISQYFYADIWQSLTWEEKFLLYDLAEDGLVNSYDDFNLTMLICKKLIRRHDGTLTVFNRGFRNFILTCIEKKEMIHIKQQIKNNSRWGDLKTPLNIVILAILIFLFASQQEAYSRVVTFITAFSAGIPTIFKIFTMFSGGGKTPKPE